jgi:hypothetical protein
MQCFNNKKDGKFRNDELWRRKIENPKKNTSFY